MSGLKIEKKENQPLNLVSETIQQTQLGEPNHFQNLSVFPFLGQEDTTPDYLTLDEAMAAGLSEVREVSVRTPV